MSEQEPTADDRRPLFADYIAYNYGLDITPPEALELLRKD